MLNNNPKNRDAKNSNNFADNISDKLIKLSLQSHQDDNTFQEEEFQLSILNVEPKYQNLANIIYHGIDHGESLPIIGNPQLKEELINFVEQEIASLEDNSTYQLHIKQNIYSIKTILSSKIPQEKIARSTSEMLKYLYLVILINLSFHLKPKPAPTSSGVTKKRYMSL